MELEVFYLSEGKTRCQVDSVQRVCVPLMPAARLDKDDLRGLYREHEQDQTRTKKVPGAYVCFGEA